MKPINAAAWPIISKFKINVLSVQLDAVSVRQMAPAHNVMLMNISKSSQYKGNANVLQDFTSTIHKKFVMPAQSDVKTVQNQKFVINVMKLVIL